MSSTPIADMLEEMAVRGSTLEQAIPAVRARELDGVSQNVTRNVTQRHAQRNPVMTSMTPGAIRSRRYRKNLKQNQTRAEANDAAEGDAEAASRERHAQRHAINASCDLSSSFKKETSEEEKKERKKEKTEDARARGARLAADAILPEADRDFARGEGMADSAIDRAWAEFVDYWISIPGQRGTKLNWSATWRNRVRAIATRGKSNENPNSVHAAARRLRTFVNKFDEPIPTELCDGAGGTVVRLLSKG